MDEVRSHVGGGGGTCLVLKMTYIPQQKYQYLAGNFSFLLAGSETILEKEMTTGPLTSADIRALVGLLI